MMELTKELGEGVVCGDGVEDEGAIEMGRNGVLDGGG